MNIQDKKVYDRRWAKSSGTSDEDILSLENPKTQVSFFYYQYNRFISKQFLDYFGDTEGRKLLEIGCGRGTSSIFQAIKSGMDVVPTDYSDGAVKIAQRNLDKYGVTAKAYQADMFNLPFEEKTFDAVISLGVMEHIEKATDAYHQMWKMLKPGGMMISMNVPEKPNNIQRIAVPINKLFLFIRNFLSKEDKKPWLDSKSRSKTADVYRTECTGIDFSEFAKEAGFDEVEIYEINPFPTIDPLPKWADRLVVKFYNFLLYVRKVGGMKEPFCSTKRNSRTHFIVAIKNQ